MSINNTKMPVEYLQEMRQLRENISEGNAVWADAADIRAKYGLNPVSIDTIRKGAFLYDEFNESGWINEPIEKKFITKEVVGLNADGSRTSDKIVELSETDLTDSQALLRAHGFNPVNFKLFSAKNSKWQQGDGKGGTKNLYSSKICVQPVTNGLDYEDIKKYFENLSTPHKPTFDRDFCYGSGNDIMVFGHFDVHMGRVCTEHETGYEYNLEIAEANMIRSTEEMMAKASRRNIEKFIYVIGQDYFNSSSTGFTTSQSHLQDNATTFNTIFKFGTHAIIKCIDMLSSMAPVEVVLCTGNHSRFEEVAMAQIIEAYYRNDSDITVDASPMPRKYVEYGVNCIGFTHGSDEKDRIYTLMQSEVPEIWGRTTSRVWLAGHIHHNSWVAKEDSSCVVFSLSAMAKPDRWTVKSGYTMAKSGCTAFVFNYEKGLDGIEFCYV